MRESTCIFGSFQTENVLVTNHNFQSLEPLVFRFRMPHARACNSEPLVASRAGAQHQRPEQSPLAQVKHELQPPKMVRSTCRKSHVTSCDQVWEEVRSHDMLNTFWTICINSIHILRQQHVSTPSNHATQGTRGAFADPCSRISLLHGQQDLLFPHFSTSCLMFDALYMQSFVGCLAINYHYGYCYYYCYLWLLWFLLYIHMWFLSL